MAFIVFSAPSIVNRSLTPINIRRGIRICKKNGSAPIGVGVKESATPPRSLAKLEIKCPSPAQSKQIPAPIHKNTMYFLRCSSFEHSLR
jgi:hypothetical protein